MTERGSEGVHFMAFCVGEVFRLFFSFSFSLSSFLLSCGIFLRFLFGARA